ncbi:MAG: TIGR01777 family oxidoreductase [Nanobdellota archaeon]
MKISVVGGSGFVGQNLIKRLVEKNYDVVCIDIAEKINTDPSFKYISADTSVPGEWQDEITDSDAVINLAGVSIFSFWSKKYKNLIYDSRILTTQNITDAIDENRETVLLNTSAAGFYGDRKDKLLYEDEPGGDDFLAQVCRDWEKEAFKAEDKNTRVCVMRFGIVLGKGGALDKMLPSAKMMMNPVLGAGENYFPWIHIDDLVNAIIFLLENNDLSGAFNTVSGGFTTQKEFAHTIGKILKRPVLLRIPEFIIRFFGGDLGKSFLCSQKASPEKLKSNGFKFRYSDVEDALRNIIMDKN